MATKNDCPWAHIEPDGSNLTVEDFLTVPIVRLSTFMRRVPVGYTQPHGLTLPEWRLLSTVEHFGSVPFGQLVHISSADKALVSRTVRQLEAQGLIEVQPDPDGNRKKLNCAVTKKGRALTRKILPEAQRRQADLLLSLPKNDRIRLHGILQKLLEVCRDEE
jgi:DNA-binding MarR family transcriptional regulator